MLLHTVDDGAGSAVSADQIGHFKIIDGGCLAIDKSGADNLNIKTMRHKVKISDSASDINAALVGP